MAKLDGKKAAEAAEASSGFEPVPDGVYHAILKDVDATREGPKGPYWSWEFELIGDPVEVPIEEPKKGGPTTKTMKIEGRKQWNNTSLKAMWSFQQTFTALGTDDMETDTDELLGKPVKLHISIRTIEHGARAGELTNQINRVAPPDMEDPVVVSYLKRTSDAKEMADLF